MTRNQRAAQLWSLLALAARNQEVLSYEMIGELTGLNKKGLGPYLGPIQNYCIRKKLPPLTAIAILKATGLPGDGFIGAQDVLPAQNRVFVYNWLSHKAPSPDDFTQAAGIE